MDSLISLHCLPPLYSRNKNLEVFQRTNILWVMKILLLFLHHEKYRSVLLVHGIYTMIVVLVHGIYTMSLVYN